MKERKSGRGSFDADGFVKLLAQLVETLPSIDEQEKSAAALDAMIRYLTDVKERVASMPTRDDTKAMKLTLEDLSALFAKAKANPLLAAAIGIRTLAPRPSTSLPSSEEVENAKRSIAQFDELPIDEIRSALANKNSVELKALATELGLRSTQRSSREGLCHQIATRITNTRGYRSLRDGDRSNDT
ncbi:hypothetical protein ACQPTN_17015 [Bradyrhizobium sp. 13971]